MIRLCAPYLNSHSVMVQTPKCSVKFKVEIPEESEDFNEMYTLNTRSNPQPYIVP